MLGMIIQNIPIIIQIIKIRVIMILKIGTISHLGQIAVCPSSHHSFIIYIKIN